ncbi:hypothetical protein [Parafrankia discariae]|uniref:hypothetical protein n=1 Tax=Parafrankia discariae TaxID=365528 RepID=UPI00038231DF|nr:hypothetical protein [Parafrankia discariae]
MLTVGTRSPSRRGVDTRRIAVAWALLGPTLRVLPWVPLIACMAVGLALVGAPAAASVELAATDTLMLVRLAAVTGAIGVAFVLTDPAHRTVAALPTPRLLRHAVRVAVPLPGLAAWWCAVLAIATAHSPEPARAVVRPGALTLELGALVAVAAAAGALGVRLEADGNPGVIAAPSVLVLVAAARVTPGTAALFVSPADPRWHDGHVIWTVVLVAGAVLFLTLGNQSAGRPAAVGGR